MSFIKKTAATLSTAAATVGFYAGEVFAQGETGLDKGIFQSNNNPLHAKGVKVIQTVGGLGGLAFTLAIMIITLFIIFGSISPQKRGTYWIALISCVAGAFVFFSCYTFAESIMTIATGQ